MEQASSAKQGRRFLAALSVALGLIGLVLPWCSLVAVLVYPEQTLAALEATGVLRTPPAASSSFGAALGAAAVTAGALGFALLLGLALGGLLCLCAVVAGGVCARGAGFRLGRIGLLLGVLGLASAVALALYVFQLSGPVPP